LICTLSDFIVGRGLGFLRCVEWQVVEPAWKKIVGRVVNRDCEARLGQDEVSLLFRRAAAHMSMKRHMRLIHVSVTAMLFASWACAQSGSNMPVGTAVYFLKDEMHRQWCRYARQSELKAHIRAVRAMTVGNVEYKNGRVFTIRVREQDETGDWEVQDEYTVDSAGKIRRGCKTDCVNDVLR
jgi:hypothetical protein